MEIQTDNKEILEKAIQKAIEGGWKPGWYIKNYKHFQYQDPDRGAPAGWYDYEDSLEINTLIFNHDFAKALWGETAITIDEGCAYPDYEQEVSKHWQNHYMSSWDYDMPAWAFHLTKMVIADDPIKYLGENI